MKCKLCESAPVLEGGILSDSDHCDGCRYMLDRVISLNRCTLHATATGKVIWQCDGYSCAWREATTTRECKYERLGKAPYPHRCACEQARDEVAANIERNRAK